MCGIAGLLTFDPEERPLSGPWMDRAMDLMVPRGPDAEGRWTDYGITMGARRLRIHDITPRSDQPFISADGAQVIVFNGAILNYRDLQVELRALGHRFRTTSDTEVALAALIQWGAEEAFRRFEGMFAIAWYDRRAKRLVLGRDKFGIKPLYLHRTAKRLVFASEIKPILAHPKIDRCIDPLVLPEQFAYQTIMPPRTIFRDIELLTPGHCLEASVEGSEFRVIERCYWRLDASLVERPATWIDIEEIVADSLARCMSMDRRVAIQLSGGVDSSLLAALASNRLGYRETSAYSVIFDESRHHYAQVRSEEPYVRQVVERCGMSLVTSCFDDRAIALSLPEAVWHQETPLYSANTVLYLLHARDMRGKVEVLVSGEGADDIFLGYFDNAVFTDNPLSYTNMYLKPAQLSALFGADGPDQGTARRLDLMADDRLRGMTHAQKASVMTIKTVLHGLLGRQDRMLMAYSIEGRPPYCTEALVRARFAIPDTEIHGSSGGKIKLRQLAARYFGDDFAYRRKQWLAGPVSDWCSNPTIWRPYVDAIDWDVLGAYFNPDPIRRLLAMDEGAAKWSGSNLALAFTAVNFSLWHRMFIESSSTFDKLGWRAFVPLGLASVAR